MSSFFYLFLFFLSILILELSSSSTVILIVAIFVFLFSSTLASVGQSGLVSLLSEFLFGLVLVFFSTSSLLVFFVTYELSLVPVCLLISLFGYQPEKLNALLSLLLYTVVCSLPFLLFSVSSNSMLWTSLRSLSHLTSSLVSLSFLVKSPMYTLHLWLPKAHVEAPLLGSVFLAGIMLKLGGYGLLLMSPALSSHCSLFFYLTLLGGVVCSIICWRSWDFKCVVAYSSVVHIGIVTCGCLSGLELGSRSALGIMVGHSLCSPVLFVLANDFYIATGSRCFALYCTSRLPMSLLYLLGLFAGLNFGLPPFVSF